MAEGAKRLDEAGLKVDYIITHEPPSLVKSAILMRRGAGYDDGAHGCGDGGDGQQGEYQSEGDLHTMLFL